MCRSQSGRGRDRGVELRGTTGGFLRPPLDYPRTWPVLWLACGLAQKPQFAHTFALWLPRVRSGHSSRRRQAPAMHLAGAPPIDPTDWQHQSRPHDGPSAPRGRQLRPDLGPRRPTPCPAPAGCFTGIYGDAPPGHMLQPRVDVLVVCGSHKTTLVGAGRLSVGGTPVQMLHG